MRLWISFILLLSGFSDLCFAKHKFNPKIKRKSFVPDKELINYYNSNRLDVNPLIVKKLIYIYIYPKNIDKMIKENPEFKDEIMKKTKYLLTVKKLKEQEYGSLYSSCYNFYDSWKLENPEDEIDIRNCYDLWQHDPLICDTVGMDEQWQFEQHCNKIIKKVLKQTGKLY